MLVCLLHYSCVKIIDPFQEDFALNELPCMCRDGLSLVTSLVSSRASNQCTWKVTWIQSLNWWKGMWVGPDSACITQLLNVYTKLKILGVIIVFDQVRLWAIMMSSCVIFSRKLMLWHMERWVFIFYLHFCCSLSKLYLVVLLVWVEN
jgi:hypothetical protein